jgi:hypothetical protein
VIARKSVAVAVAVLIIAGLVTALQMPAAQPLNASDSQRTVVAAVAAESVTEYEPDPFEPERLRSSTVRVKRIAVVYSDGTVQVQRTE